MPLTAEVHERKTNNTQVVITTINSRYPNSLSQFNSSISIPKLCVSETSYYLERIHYHDNKAISGEELGEVGTIL